MTRTGCDVSPDVNKIASATFRISFALLVMFESVLVCFFYEFNNMSSECFVKAASNNLPAVDMFIVTEFIKSDPRFNAAEIKGAKAAV